MTQLTLFDYQQLSTDIGHVVQLRTAEIKTLMRRTAQDIVDIGLKLIEVKELLGHTRFGPWLDSEFGWSHRQAQRFINVASEFGAKSDKLSHFAPSALYLLSAPSTPDEARQEALSLAGNGHNISHSSAQDIVESHKRNGYYRADSSKPLTSRDETTVEPWDRCQTPPSALNPLYPYLEKFNTIWEPAAGKGYLVGALTESGWKVADSDILTGQNFFDYEPDSWDVIVTNPPYTIKYLWLKRCYELGKPFALLLPDTTLYSQSGQVLFSQYGLELILLKSRVNFEMPIKKWDGKGAPFYTAWFTWGLDIGRQITYATLDHDNQIIMSFGDN